MLLVAKWLFLMRVGLLRRLFFGGDMDGGNGRKAILP